MPEDTLEMSPEMVEHLAQRERAIKHYEAKKRKKKSRSQWGDEREDLGYPDYDY